MEDRRVSTIIGMEHSTEERMASVLFSNGLRHGDSEGICALTSRIHDEKPAWVRSSAPASLNARSDLLKTRGTKDGATKAGSVES